MRVPQTMSWSPSFPGSSNTPGSSTTLCVQTRTAILLTLCLTLELLVISSASAQLGISDAFQINGGIESQLGYASAVGDFNGDGYQDLAIGLPTADTAGADNSGAVVIFHGNHDFLSSSLGVTATLAGGADESGALFGAALATGDFDNNGFDDLVIGIPGKVVNGADNAGQLVVLYSDDQGLDLEGQFLSQAPLPGVPEAGDQFGSSFAVGDLSQDFVDDLAIGIPGEDLQGETGLQQDAGAVNIVYGSAGVGLTTDGDQLLHEDTNGVGLNANANERFGFSLAIGHFDGLTPMDLVVGAPGEVVLGPGHHGAAIIFPGSRGGLDPLGSEETVLSQAADGVLGNHQDGDEFGYSLAAGFFNADSRVDLAIGVPGESELGTNESGAVQVFYGAFGGLSVEGNQFLVESVLDVDVAPFDRFGEALAAGDFNADGEDDLAIGAPLDNSLGVVNSGEVTVLYGGLEGISIEGFQVFDMIFFDTLDAGDRFGFSLSAGRFFREQSQGTFPNPQSEDLVVGAPLRASDQNPVGRVVVIRSISIFLDGFESGDLTKWDIANPPRSSDRFGSLGCLPVAAPLRPKPQRIGDAGP
ncbi:MAG: integrin alpha [Thermoanaerobaculia bacterium]|nr:integrin alpha [Thermoanaerobaculia bacterium]